MGLSLTINKINNFLYMDIVDAYWSIDEISYTTNVGYMTIHIYPSREAKFKTATGFHPILPVTAEDFELVSPIIDTIKIRFNLIDVFDSIPLDINEQKTLLYIYFKQLTGLPFKDVLEEMAVDKIEDNEVVDKSDDFFTSISNN